MHGPQVLSRPLPHSGRPSRSSTRSSTSQRFPSRTTIFGNHRSYGNRHIFQVPDGNGGFKVIMRHKFDKWFKICLGIMGLNPALYTLHGFRHAGIQECLLAEGNLALCKLTSDHSSDAIMEYAFIPPGRRLSISAKVNESLASAVAVSAESRSPRT